MKNFFVNLGFFLLFAFWLGPLALLLVEGAWMFCTGHVLTGIPWNETRVIVVIMWTLFIGFLGAGMS
jgi:hypothetical protein